MDLDNAKPVDLLDPANRPWAARLQGNILNGHGRDFTANLFLRLPDAEGAAGALVKQLAAGVTTAEQQEKERRTYNRFGIPGGTFRTILLSASGYRRLGFAQLDLAAKFADAADGTPTRFVDGAEAAIHALTDPPKAAWDAGLQQELDVLVILAEDSEQLLLASTRTLAASLPEGVLQHVEYGIALRTAEGEGIEHFGYVDGRSQPLYTTRDFILDADGSVKVFPEGKPREANGGRTDIFDPFASLATVLVPDPLAPGDPHAFGSYFVFRKLEQNVREFKLAEQLLASRLGLSGGDRERAGAMAIGRFEDGTPVVLSQTDGFVPAKENNFTYRSTGTDSNDPNGLKCPVHAHIRKTNPRGETGLTTERGRRITRRGITYGKRVAAPQEKQDIGDLPADGVGLLFMCYQASIPHQFGFMQRDWANSDTFFQKGPTGARPGIDPVIGQFPSSSSPTPQTWRAAWGADDPGLPPAKQSTPFGMHGFVTMKGGEFFFAPSIPFLQGLGDLKAAGDLKAPGAAA